MPAPKLFKSFLNRVRKSTTRFPCPSCGVVLLPKEFESHCSTEHNLNPMLCCVWCSGNRVWGRGEKNQHANHLLRCLNQFIILNHFKRKNRRNVTPPPSCPKLPSSMRSTDLACEPRNFFGCERLDGLHDLAYESIFEPPESFWGEFDLFSCQNLNLAAACIQLYLETRQEWKWFHVMVHGVAFNSFYRAMELDCGRTFILPFWCWCNGGQQKEARFRMHRHMIVASPDNFLKNVWRKIKADDRPRANLQTVNYRRIEVPLHLLNALLYLSRRKSECSVSFDVSTDLNHFCVNRPLAPSSKWALSTLWEEGLLQLVAQYGNRTVIEKLAFSARMIDGTWKILVRDMPSIPKNLVLPVRKHFRPTQGQVTDRFLHLAGGRKLYFREDATLNGLDDESWLRLQAENGNVFCWNVWSEMFQPTHKQCQALDVIVPLRERVGILEKENEELVREGIVKDMLHEMVINFYEPVNYPSQKSF